MKALDISSLYKALIASKSKVLFFLVPIIPVLMLASLHFESVMPTIWGAVIRLFEAPAFPFLFLNCLIVTIIASTKMQESDIEKEGHAAIEEEEPRKSWGSLRETEQGDEKGGFSATDVGSTRGARGQRYDVKGGEEYLAGRSCYLDASCEEHGKPYIIVTEKKPIVRAHISGASEKKPNSTSVNGGTNFSLISDRRVSPAKAALEPSRTLNDHADEQPLGRAGTISDHHQPLQARESHPCLQQVWAAILSDRQNDDRKPISHNMQATDRSSKGSIYGNDRQTFSPAAAPATADAPRPFSAAVAVRHPGARAWRTPAAAQANPPKGIKTTAPNLPEKPSDELTAATAETRHAAAAADDDDGEVQELNRRVEEFIERFNHRMRLQFQESLQRRHRPSNHHHLQLITAPALLVG